jgi:hypothetical protein
MQLMLALAAISGMLFFGALVNIRAHSLRAWRILQALVGLELVSVGVSLSAPLSVSIATVIGTAVFSMAVTVGVAVVLALGQVAAARNSHGAATTREPSSSCYLCQTVSSEKGELRRCSATNLSTAVLARSSTEGPDFLAFRAGGVGALRCSPSIYSSSRDQKGDRNDDQSLIVDVARVLENLAVDKTVVNQPRQGIPFVKKPGIRRLRSDCPLERVDYKVVADGGNALGLLARLVVHHPLHFPNAAVRK